MNLAFSHEPGTAISCLSIPIILHKEGPPGVPETELKCGFKIGGGIDQDYKKSPQVGFYFQGGYIQLTVCYRAMQTVECTLQRSRPTAPPAGPGWWCTTRSCSSTATTSPWSRTRRRWTTSRRPGPWISWWPEKESHKPDPEPVKLHSSVHIYTSPSQRKSGELSQRHLSIYSFCHYKLCYVFVKT